MRILSRLLTIVTLLISFLPTDVVKPFVIWYKRGDMYINKLEGNQCSPPIFSWKSFLKLKVDSLQVQFSSITQLCVDSLDIISKLGHERRYLSIYIKERWVVIAHGPFTTSAIKTSPGHFAEFYWQFKVSHSVVWPRMSPGWTIYVERTNSKRKRERRIVFPPQVPLNLSKYSSLSLLSAWRSSLKSVSRASTFMTSHLGGD